MIEELGTGAGAAALQIRAVAVDVILRKTPYVEVALQRPEVGQRIFSVQGHEAHLVVCSLWRGEDRPIVEIEKLHRGRGRHPE